MYYSRSNNTKLLHYWIIEFKNEAKIASINVPTQNFLEKLCEAEVFSTIN